MHVVDALHLGVLLQGHRVKAHLAHGLEGRSEAAQRL